jgi:hypothetical protein
MRTLPDDSIYWARIAIAAELQLGPASDTEVRAAFRVCEKLRQSLSALVGVTGFRLLRARALNLQRVEFPWLGQLEAKADGVLTCPAATEADLTEHEARAGSAALIAQLLGLLMTFIGTALTQRLLLDSWPKAALAAKETTNQR